MKTFFRTAIIAGLVVLLFVWLWQQDEKVWKRIDDKCVHWLAMASDRRDSLQADIACEQLKSNKRVEDAANTAAAMATSAAAAAAARR